MSGLGRRLDKGKPRETGGHKAAGLQIAVCGTYGIGVKILCGPYGPTLTVHDSRAAEALRASSVDRLFYTLNCRAAKMEEEWIWE